MRFRPYGMMTGKGIKRPPVHPQEYSAARFEGIRCGYDLHKNPVIIMRSKGTGTLGWKVEYGLSRIFFRTLAEAVEFCNSRGFQMVREQTKKV